MDSMPNDLAKAGSQRWIQVAVNRRPETLLAALRKAGVVSPDTTVRWASPLETEGFREYRDLPALGKAGIKQLRVRPLKEFWPARGPVWDAIGLASNGQAIFVEAKAHIPEAASPGCRATAVSLPLILQSLAQARRAYAPKATAAWNGLFYQYANRLAHQYLVNKLNGVRTALVFLYFVNALEMKGPDSEAEWRGAVRLLHASLGLQPNLEAYGVFDVFLDVRELADAV